MGFMRKALFLGTGGLSGAAGIKANSKKERTAKALEKQVRMQKQMMNAQQATLAQPTAAIPQTYYANCPRCRKMLHSPAGDIVCPRCGTTVSVRGHNLASAVKVNVAASTSSQRLSDSPAPDTVCTRCGHANVGHPRRCKQCGTDL